MNITLSTFDKLEVHSTNSTEHIELFCMYNGHIMITRKKMVHKNISFPPIIAEENTEQQ